MKAFLTRVSLLLSLVLLQHQAGFLQPAGIRVIDLVPFDIYTDGFLETPGPDNQLLLFSDTAAIWLTRPANNGAAIVFQFGRPLPFKQWADLEFRISTNGHDSLWNDLVPASFHPLTDSLQLGRIHLAPGQHVRLQFRNRSDARIIGEQLIERRRIIPVLNGIRQHAGSHSDREQLKSDIMKQHPAAGDSAGLEEGNNMLLEAGTGTDLLFDNQSVNADSVLEYSLYDIHTSRQPVWQATGHILHLPAMPGDAHFILRLRYAGMPDEAGFFVSTRAYWYQQPVIRGLLLLIGIFILSGLLIFYYRRYSREERLKRQKVEQQLKRVHNQLNPHFVYNSLSSISGIISSGNRESAVEYLGVFAGIMRHTMDVSDKAVISLASDLEQMEKYLRIEQMRFGFRFCFEISPSLNINHIELPPQLLQPTLENAVKHGASSLLQFGEVKLQVYYKEADLYIRISNNAQSNSPKKPDARKGYGLQFTHEQMAQLRLLNKPYRVSYDLAIREDGADALFFFENWLK